MAVADLGVASAARRRTGRLIAVVAAFVAPLAFGVVLLGHRGASDGSTGVRAFGAATIEVPAGWEAPSSRPQPDPEEAFEIRRTVGGQVVAAAVLLNAVADVDQAVGQNGGVVLDRRTARIGGQPAELVESTNVTHWHYLDAVIRSAGLTVSLRWDPAEEHRPAMDKVLSGISLSSPAGLDGPIPIPGGRQPGS